MLSEVVARRLLFILIKVDDALNAYTLFETLNARGLELTTTDLLKNYFFSKVRPGPDIESLRRRWQRLLAAVTQERFPDFLRYRLLCEQPKIRRQRLFKLVRDRVRTPDETFDFMKDLEEHAELFAALTDVDHGCWIDRPEAKRFVWELNLFRARQLTPVLFAAWDRFADDDFVRLLKLASVIAFRYSVVSGLNPNMLERVSHFAARAVLDGRANQAGRLREEQVRADPRHPRPRSRGMDAGVDRRAATAARRPRRAGVASGFRLAARGEKPRVAPRRAARPADKA